MKKVLLTTMCLMTMCMVTKGNEPNQPVKEMTFRILTEPSSQNTDIEGWLGFRKGDSEVGLILGYIDEQTERDASMTIGGYTAFHFPDVRQLVENTFWVAEWLPESIEATPAVGMSFVYNLETYALTTTPFVALRVYKTLEIQLGYDALQGETVEQDGFKIGISSSWRFQSVVRA